ncbi:hypothetical protein JXA40_09750 [bacterium]|nr:hypothetical protein [candidate division CSSED10-310 bacterium]
MPESERGWRKLKRRISEAFRVEPEKPFEPTVRQREIIDKLADWVVRRRLTLPAVMFLESMTPLNYLGSQVLVFFHPFVAAFLSSADYNEFQQMLEYRESIPVIIQAIEDCETKFVAKKKQRKSSKSSEGSKADDTKA